MASPSKLTDLRAGIERCEEALSRIGRDLHAQCEAAAGKLRALHQTMDEVEMQTVRHREGAATARRDGLLGPPAPPC